MKQYTIRQYVAWLTLVPLLVMALSLATFFLHTRSTDLDRTLMEHGQLIARQLASSSEYGVFANNQQFLQNITQGVLQQPDVRGVIILNAASQSLIEAGVFSKAAQNPITDASLKVSKSVEAEPFDPTKTISASKAKELVNLRNPVLSLNESLWIYQPIIPIQIALDDLGGKPEVQPIGAVIIEMSWAHTHKLKLQMLLVTIGVTGWFLIFSFYLVILASRRLTSPICQLSEAVQIIGEGNLDMCVSLPTRITELRTLAHGINDMTAQLQQENLILHQRVEEATRLAAIAFESHEGMMVADADGVIMRVNAAFTKITGYSDEDAVGQTPNLLQSGRHNADFYAGMWESINNTGLWQGEIWNRRKNGEAYLAWLTITVVRKDDNAVAYYVATYTDITVRKAADDEIKNLAFYDDLTHLPNRRMLMDRLGLALAANKRSGSYGALMFLDLDNFKPLNDQYGHEVGDLYLIELARRLGSGVREADTIARFGGDEFVVMLNALDVDQVELSTQVGLIAEKIRLIVAEPYTLEIQQKNLVATTINHQCTASIGVVLLTAQQTSPEDILKCADIAMYQAKREGGNRVRFYE
jgi:diguanylate cyclase (GGDEF)-like protein/PAS domain S-box-containing protein